MMNQRTKEIIDTLAQLFPSPRSELNFENNFQLLCAVILSAQCTDKRVNQVTKELFAVAGTPEELFALSDQELEQIIRPCGFYKVKAKYLKSAAHDILTRFGGEVPSDPEQLRSLAGVGRKTANVVIAVGFGGQAIAVDTHVFRVSRRLGLADGNTPEKVEMQLMTAIDRELWSVCHHYFILFGRYRCKARNPLCESCPLQHLCLYYALRLKQ